MYQCLFSIVHQLLFFVRTCKYYPWISPEVLLLGFTQLFLRPLQFFPFPRDRRNRYYQLHVTNCCVWRTMCKSAARSISPGTSKTVLSILMMPMCLLTYLWKGELADRYYCREVELLMDYFQELHGLLPGDASGLLLQPSVCPNTSLLPHASGLLLLLMQAGRKLMFQEVDFSLKKKKRCTIAWNGLIPAPTLLLCISCYCILDNQI